METRGEQESRRQNYQRFNCEKLSRHAGFRALSNFQLQHTSSIKGYFVDNVKEKEVKISIVGFNELMIDQRLTEYPFYGDKRGQRNYDLEAVRLIGVTEIMH